MSNSTPKKPLIMEKCPTSYCKCEWCKRCFYNQGSNMCLESYCSPKCRYEATGKRPKDNPCFITTAVCEQSGLPDHCFELTTLRAFRDRHMSTSEDNRKLLEQYYVIAPRIVEKIDQMANRNEIYALLREKFITPSVEAADQGNDMKAQEIYVAMMQWVEALVEVHQ